MQIKFLKSIVEHLINKQAVPIVDLLAGKKDINEFLIAKKLNLTINQTRNILYKLSDFGLVSFIRKKDKRKGWYIYFWTLNVYQSLNLLEKKLKDELEQIEIQLKSRNEKRYFICNTCSLEVGEESALLNDFTCPECEQVYELADNREIISQLEKEAERIKKEIALVVNEREQEGSKLEKKKVSKIKKAEAKKKEIRKKGREDRAKEKKRLKDKESNSSSKSKKQINSVKSNISKKVKKNISKIVKKLKKKI